MKRINNSQDIINRIKSYKYVSFDLFDTLIKRDVPNPADVFKLIENKGYPGFQEARIIAERKARKESEKEEITLDDIYLRLDKRLVDCKIIEANLEISICTANRTIKTVYDFCLQNQIKIIITTDIYLGRKIIDAILSKCGYDYYDALFISSERGCMKNSGKLFDIVLNDVGISAKDLIHIGDNEQSDYTIPINKGIDAVLIERKIDNLQYAKYSNNVVQDYWAAFTNNHLVTNNHFYSTGYECFGPLLYGFTKWLIKELEKNNIKKVFFLSRDGHIMKKAFDKIYKGEIQTEYLFVSRKALLVPSLKLYGSVTDYKNTYYFPYSFTSKKLCKMMGCEEQKVIDKIVKETNTEDYLFYRETIATDKQFDQVYYHTCDVLADYIDDQYNLFKRYLKETKFEGRVAIVDIGWHGNMQKNLEALASSYGFNCDIYGYYVAMTPSEGLKKRSNMRGFLFDSFHNQELNQKEQLFNAAFELLFTGEHGTVLGYSAGNAITAKMGSFEIEDKESLDLIRNYQNGALAFCKDADEEAIYEELPVKYITDVLFSQFLAPTLYDAQKWGNVTHEDNGRKKMVLFRNKRYYILHPKDMIRDYHNSIWKIGFLKQLIGQGINYDKAVMGLSTFMRMIRGKNREKGHM